MSSFSETTIQSCMQLQAGFHDILKCHYCNGLLKSARTLNCIHHVCESCAIAQLDTEGGCKECNSTYFTKDISQNVGINNCVQHFHSLQSVLEHAMNIMSTSTNSHSTKNRKRKLEPTDDSEMQNMENMEMDGPKSKRRRLNESDEIFQPSNICITGYHEDKGRRSELMAFADSLGMNLNTKWKEGTTQMLLSKYNAFNGFPNLTFKGLASILCDIPVIKESFLEDSYNRNEILDYKDYVCNYQRVDNSKGIFKGLDFLFATTNMSLDKLKILIRLGKGRELRKPKEIYENKNEKDFEKRIMVCSADTHYTDAIDFRKKHNCRVISESWVINCIYKRDIQSGGFTQKYTKDYYAMEPIKERAELDEYDKCIKREDDTSSSEDESEESDSDV